MKRKILTGVFLSALGFLLLNSSNGAGASQNADRTGGPVANGNCNGCHSGGTVIPTVTVGLFDGLLPVTSYTPGKSYTLRIIVLGLGYPRYGFQTVALASGNVNAGTITAGSTGTRAVTINSRIYGEHSTPSSTGTFDLNWKAPAAGTGTVNFYTAGLGAANPSGDNGDKGNTNTLTISEAAGTSVSAPQMGSMHFGPNPVAEVMHFYGSAWSNISVYNLQGQLQARFTGMHESINLSTLTSGVYLLQAEDASGKQCSLRFIKE
ncbi:MAG: T9SS type A sorting domain-containing protein [Bacteroidetes bacterium]|nr:T9SS type A sorting domain-containing protein [Bacteroidota bacterium]